jgi:hypothetical protein
MKESNVVRRAKKRARDMSRSDGITHQQALDAIAVEAGHPHWAAMAAAHPSVTKAGQVASSTGMMTIAEVKWPPSKVDAFDPRWLHVSSLAGQSLEGHLSAAASLVVGRFRERSVVIDIVTMTAIRLIECDGDGSLSWQAVSKELKRRMGTASAKCALHREESIASKQLPTATVLSLLVKGLSDDAGELGAHIVSRMLTHAEFMGPGERESTMREIGIVAMEDGSPMIEWARLQPLGDVGAAASLLACHVRPIGLKRDEARMLRSGFVEAVRGHVPSSDAMVTLSRTSPAIAAACRALAILGDVDPSVILGVLDHADLFPIEEGSMNDELDSVSHGVAILPQTGEVFSRWIVDAVAKARTGGRVFRYDPLKAMGDGTDADASIGLLAGQMAILGSSPEGGSGYGSKAFMTLVALARLGFRNGTLSDLCPHADVSDLRMTTLVDLHDQVRRIGEDQVVLYATVNGLSKHDEAGIRVMFEPTTAEVMERALSVFRHPAIAAAC